MGQNSKCTQMFLSLFIMSQVMDTQLIRHIEAGIVGYGTSAEATNSSAFQLKGHSSDLVKGHQCIAKICDPSYIFKNCTPETSLENNVSCCYCLEDRDTNFTLVCNTANNSQLHDTFIEISGKLPGIQALVIIIENKWQGYYPFTTAPIDLTEMKPLKDLRKFQLLPCYSYFTQEYSFEFDKTTFRGINGMREFVINLPIKTGSHLAKVVKHFKYLEFLDLSFTRNLTMAEVSNILQNVNNVTLKYLYLITFQLAGGRGYSPNLDWGVLFSHRQFQNLETLAISENSIARWKPGLSYYAPNLKKLYVSGNILLDASNICALIESLLLPHLVIFDGAHQGFVGGGKYKYKHVQGNYLTSTRQQSFQVYDETYEVSDKHRIQSVSPGGYSQMLYCVNKIMQEVYPKPNISFQFNTNLTSKHGEFWSCCLQCILPFYFEDRLPPRVIPDIGELVDSSCMFFINFPLGPKLEKIYLQKVMWEASSILGVKLEGKFCLNRNNSLKYIYFGKNAGWMEAIQFAYTLNHTYEVTGFEHLKGYDLSENRLHFGFKINNRSIPTLKYLNVSGNFINVSSVERYCNGYPSITVLDISKCSLGVCNKFQPNTLKNCTKLKKLFLSNNQLKIYHLSGVEVRDLISLELLDLSNNLFSTMDEEIINKLDELSHLTRSQPLKINLMGNPLQCKCYNIPFIRWVSSKSPNIHFVNRKSYRCTGQEYFVWQLDNITEADISSFQKRCTHVYIIVESVFSTLAAVLLITVFIQAYKNRWKLRYQLFKFQQCCIGRFQFRNDEDMTGKCNWQYDAYLCFYDLDRFFVRHILMNRLEGEYSFKLYNRLREGPVGGSIAATIIEKMQESREIIVILSNGALSRQWWQFEVEHARIISRKRKRDLIVVKLEDLDSILEFPLITHILHAHICLEWADDDRTEIAAQENNDKDAMRKLFWARLVRLMYGGSFERYATVSTSNYGSIGCSSRVLRDTGNNLHSQNNGIE